MKKYPPRINLYFKPRRTEFVRTDVVVKEKNTLLVTNGDNVLCEECHRDRFCEEDPTTHFYKEVEHGICESCGFKVK